MLVWTIFVIGGAGTKLSRIRFKTYRLAVSKNPFISKDSIVELYDIPKKRVEHDFRLIQKYNIYPTCPPQAKEEPKEEPESVPIRDSCIERLKVLNRKISNEDLHYAVEELVKVSELWCDFPAVDHLVDFYLPRIESLLDRYISIGMDTPEGYEDLLKLISVVTQEFNQIKDTGKQQEEMDFSAEVSAVLQSASMNMANSFYDSE